MHISKSKFINLHLRTFPGVTTEHKPIRRGYSTMAAAPSHGTLPSRNYTTSRDYTPFRPATGVTASGAAGLNMAKFAVRLVFPRSSVIIYYRNF